MQESTPNAPLLTPQDDPSSNGQALPQSVEAAPRVVREPPTGEEFLEGLRDGRVIYFDGELVKDVTTHPPLPPVPARMPACMTRSTTRRSMTF